MRTRLGLALLALGGLAFGLAGGPAGALGDETKDRVTVEVGKKQADFRVGGALAARYHFGPEAAKPYFWPLNAPGGVTVTRGWPMAEAEPGELKDHVHQKSAWFCHGDVIPEGVELKDRVRGVDGVDFWSENKGHGRMVCTEVGSPRQGKDQASVVTRNEWQTARGEKILDEARTIRLYDLGGAYLFVLDIDLHASVCPIAFGDTKEGSLGVRLRDGLTEGRGKGRLTNAEGKAGAKAVWGQRSAWNDYSGPLGGGEAPGEGRVGVAIFDDAANPHPACWHSRDYGLMAANPFGRARAGFPGARDRKELVRLDKGQHLKLRYGILLHTGDVKAGKVAELYEQFLKLKG